MDGSEDMTLEQLKQVDAGIKHSPAFAQQRIPTLEASNYSCEEVAPGDCNRRSLQEALDRRKSVPHGVHSLSVDLQRRILAASEVTTWHRTSRAWRQAAREYASEVLHSPWWLLDADGHTALAKVFTWCPPSCLLRSACVCHAWRRAAESREAWASLRLSFGWGAEKEMRCLLRSLRLLGLRHNLTELPEVRPPSPLASTPSSPGTPMGCLDGYRFAPPSPSKGSLTQPSQLTLCRHWSPFSGSLWLLQPQGSRSQDSARRAMSNLLMAQLELLGGKTVLELNAGAGLIGLGFAHCAKTMTITAPDDLTCRLLRLNASLLKSDRRKSSRQTVATAVSRNVQVPVYVYMLPTNLEGAKAFGRQWQWDSGSAMRALKPSLLAPCFDVILNAGQPIDPQGLEMCKELMAPGGLLITVSGPLDDVSSIYRSLQVNQLAIERDEVMHDPQEGYFRMMQLKKRR